MNIIQAEGEELRATITKARVALVAVVVVVHDDGDDDDVCVSATH